MVSRLAPQSPSLVIKLQGSTTSSSVDSGMDSMGDDLDSSSESSPTNHIRSAPSHRDKTVELALMKARDLLSDQDDDDGVDLENSSSSASTSCCHSSPKIVDSLRSKPNMSILRLFAINSCVFAYGLIVATMGLIVLPLESTRLFPDDHAFMMGVMLAVTGMSQLICPIAGYLSDRSLSCLGRRRPFILVGTALGILGLYALYLCRQHVFPFTYLFSLFCATLGLNLMYSGYTALVPDLVPQSQNGLASGIMGVMGMMGSCLGFFLFGFVYPPVDSYLIYAVALGTACVLSCMAGKEEPLVSARPTFLREIARSFTIDRSTHEDFYWVFVIRTLYYMAVAVQAFILFFLRDVVKAADPAHSTSLLAMYGQIAAGLIALPAGALSQRTGRKILVLVACVVMCVVYIVFSVIDSLEVVLLMGIVYGIGNGTFLAVDYALALDTLPVDGSDTARDLGVWGVAAFLGSTLGGAIGGAILNFVGAPADSYAAIVDGGSSYYLYRGYLSLLVSGMLYLAVAVALLPRIKSAR
eukprot:gb/GEZN01005243.1/.p1 GENE.gb/GEZN01005243.1/~~gb/GEZN01005243.1/.p1  ORF type:complete len:526 (-),score=63.02 gb/GEZN01005243.1/:213-1790(-)